MLHVTDRALRVRHGDGHAAVGVGERRDTERRAARIGGVSGRGPAGVSGVAKADQAARCAGWRTLTPPIDRESSPLHSRHSLISYAVLCLIKKRAGPWLKTSI